uniref:B-cell receptor CD22 n=1 Tax=Seriola lalandi dorsalis TaxID=1841481 RepID=A0A3B4WRW4_SERLL
SLLLLPPPLPPPSSRSCRSLWLTYISAEICAVRGSTVDIRCSYRRPSTVKRRSVPVEKVLWFSDMQDEGPVDLRTDPEYTGRVKYYCDKTTCTLRIADLRESDSAEYKFKFKHKRNKRFTNSPGVTLSVIDLQVQVTRPYSLWADLFCSSSCLLPDRPSYIWYKNGQKIQDQASVSYADYFDPADGISCAVKGHEEFPSPSLIHVHIPSSRCSKASLSVSVSPSGEIVEGSSVTLSCSSDANPAANYTWYKRNVNFNPLISEAELVFRSVQSSDSGEFYCAAESELGRRTSGYIFIDVKYAPKLLSVSVSPSGEIMEGSSVNLTCSSDANPAPNYTWYKENQTLLQGPEGDIIWYIKPYRYPSVDLIKDAKYAGRVTYSCTEQSCTLMISNLKLTDSAKYGFRLMTDNLYSSRYYEPGVSLSVKGNIFICMLIISKCSTSLVFKAIM